MKKEKSKQIKQFIRYTVIGFFSVTINISVLYTLVELVSLHYLIGAFFAGVCSTTFAFYWDKRWTFKNKNKHYKTQFFRFASVITIGSIFHLLLLTFLVEIVKLWYLLSQMMIMPSIGLGNFLMNKYWTFKAKVK